MGHGREEEQRGGTGAGGGGSRRAAGLRRARACSSDGSNGFEVERVMVAKKSNGEGLERVGAEAFEIKVGLAEMLKGGVIMDVTNAEQAKLAEDAGACPVMALH